MNKLFIVVLVIIGIFIGVNASSGEIKSDSVLRKKTSEQFLELKNVPINKSLPYVDSEAVAKIRSGQDTARRMIILYHVVAVGYGVDREKVTKRLTSTDLWKYVSPEEKAFLESKKPSKQQIIDATWRVEAVWSLLWALGKTQGLDFPTKIIDPQTIQTIHSFMPKPENFIQYIKSAVLRPKNEILDATDLIYRIHWAVRDAQINGKKTPGNLNGGVVVERNYTLNWLTWYADE